MSDADRKLEDLRSLLKNCDSVLVAYSGGVDSVFLACVAHDVLGDRSLAVIADSPSLPRRELDEALSIAQKFHIPVRVIQTREFESPSYTSNPQNRCYFCKHELFENLAALAKEEQFSVIAYGEQASDIGDFRPGARAAAEFQIRAPLKEVGLTKAEIRLLSARLGLPTADKPQMACLSSRIPHGEPVSPAKLAMIERAENILRDLNFHDVRVRHHSLTGLEKALARIELGPSEIPRLLQEDLWQKVASEIQKIGYAHVTLDLRGYLPKVSLDNDSP